MTKLEKQMQEVVESRAKDYMDYIDFCILLPYLKDGIKINKSKKEIRARFGRYDYFNKVFKFTETMMAMKALRSLTCSDETRIDCIIDFINYKNLGNKAINKLARGETLYKIVLDEKIYNSYLNADNVDINGISYLVNKDFKKFILTDKVFY